MNRTLYRISMAATLALTLVGAAACGETTSDRALSGAGIGAGVGAVGGLAVGAPLQGAAIGAVVGGAAGAISSPDQINLGKPVWRN
jgi:osmotically inducible lipoprotein OsmB